MRSKYYYSSSNSSIKVALNFADIKFYDIANCAQHRKI